MKLIPKCKELLDKLYEWNLDPHLRLMQNGTTIPSDYNNVINYYNQKYDGWVNKMIGVQGESGHIVGCFMLEDVDCINRRSEIHIVFHPNGRGKALRNSTSSILNYCFAELNLKALYCTISTANRKALNFVNKTGWKEICEYPHYFNTPLGFVPAKHFVLTPDIRLL